MSGQFPYHDKPQIPQEFHRPLIFHNCCAIKCKINQFKGVFRGPISPISGNSKFRKSGTHFVHFEISGISGNPDPEKTLFSQELCAAGTRVRNLGFRVSGDLGDTFTN
jgi:hypothetical protein